MDHRSGGSEVCMWSTLHLQKAEVSPMSGALIPVPTSLSGNWVPKPVACWKPSTASKSMNTGQAKGGVGPWGQSLSFLLDNRHLLRQNPSQAEHLKCYSVFSLNSNWARAPVDLQPPGLFLCSGKPFEVQSSGQEIWCASFKTQTQCYLF